MIKKSGILPRLMKSVIWILLLLYLIALFKIICMKYLGLSDIYARITEGGGYRPYNLIPFVTMQKYFLYEQMSMLRRIGNTFGNIYLFVPIGLLLPLVIRKTRNLWLIIFISFAFSAFLEFTQYFLGSGSADIDDVILNTLGGICGYISYNIVRRIFKRESWIFISSISIFIVLIVAGGWVAMREFNLDLGLYKIMGDHSRPVHIERQISVTDSVVVIPVSEYSLMGKTESINSDTIKINTYKISKDKSGKSQTMVMVIPKNGTPFNTYILSDSTYILRKDVLQYSSTKFDIEYSLSSRDSIALGTTIQIWTSHPDTLHADTLVYWIVRNH